MSDSTTSTRERLRRWRTPIVTAAVSGGLLIGGYGIAAAADSGSPTPESESTQEAPETETSPAPDEQPRGERTQPPGDRPAPGEGSGGEPCDDAPDEAPDAGTAS